MLGGGAVVLSIFGLVDASSRSGSARVQRTILRGGAWIGALERLAMLATILAGWPEGILGIVTIKAFARYPELKTGQGSGATERFIIGTFASLGWAARLRRHRYDPALMQIAGTLDWQPAAEHPGAARPAGRRGDRCARAWTASSPPSTRPWPTRPPSAPRTTVPLDISANCVVVAGRRAEISVMAACLVLATDRADVNKTVRKHLDVRKISFASMDDAVAQTGMEYGGITPIGLPDGWPILVDAAVADDGVDRDRQRDPGQQDHHAGRRGDPAARRRCRSWPWR